ncbi:MAG: D-alanyl-D-alanine carboxypeptidase family protein [Caulobacteraceae bacterium]
MPKSRTGFRFRAVILAGVIAPMVAASRAPDCRAGPAAAAARNALTLRTLAWTPFRRPEKGWELYAPLAAREISALCAPTDPLFAARLAAWQSAHGVGAGGVMDAATLGRMELIWQARRPFVAMSRRGCPPPPPASALALAAPAESYGGKQILLRRDALDAYRRMIAAARRQVDAARADPRLFTIFSGYRSPAYDAARCAIQKNCQGVVRASCSAHRTGLAIDMDLGPAPGFPPDSSADANRLYISRGPAYRWLVANADRFGFVNYPFEPWHWEWAGSPGKPQARL